MLVWLENPLVFESWIEVRLRATSDGRDETISGLTQ